MVNGTLWLVSLAQSLTPFVSLSQDQGKTWTTVQLPGNVTIVYSPVTAVMGDRLFVIYASSADNTIWIVSTTDAVHWAGPAQLPPEGITFGIG